MLDLNLPLSKKATYVADTYYVKEFPEIDSLRIVTKAIDGGMPNTYCYNNYGANNCLDIAVIYNDNVPATTFGKNIQLSITIYGKNATTITHCGIPPTSLTTLFPIGCRNTAM